MSDLPNHGLYQQSHARPKTGEELEVLGKTASTKWLAGKSDSLNDAVVETVKSAGLSPEQVKRVCEFANTDAFLKEFKKESGVNHKVVDFDGGPADPASVIQSLNSGGQGTVMDPGMGDYDHPPTEKRASSLKEDAVLAQQFGFDPGIPFEEPLRDVMDMRDKLAGAYEHLSSQLSGLEIMAEDASEVLYQQVKQAALNGASLGDIAQVLEVGAPDAVFLKIAFEQFTPRLLTEGVYSHISEALASMDKVASRRVVDRSHPLVTCISEFAESLSKLAHTRAACQELNETQAAATAFLKSAGKEGLLLKGVRHAESAAEKAAPHVGGVAKKVVGALVSEDAGNTAGKLVGGAVKHAPKAVAAGAVLEASRRASNDPRISNAYHKAQAHLNPLSEDWDAETARQQMPAGYYPQY